MLDRPVAQVRIKARGVCEPEAKQTIAVLVRDSTWRKLDQVAFELWLSRAQLISVILNIVRRRDLWRDILQVDGEARPMSDKPHAAHVELLIKRLPEPYERLRYSKRGNGSSDHAQV